MRTPDSGAGKATATCHAPARRRELITYSVLGGILESELEFSDLPRASGRPADWRLVVADSETPCVSLTPLGERSVGPETYRLSRTPAGFRLEYSHAGCFDISTADASITWYATEGAARELARAIVLGPAITLLLEHRGLLCLHGSGVLAQNSGIAFVGPKYHGKSTIAAALTAAGARHISDDLIAIAPGRPAMLKPGVPSLRLWQDAARELNIAALCGCVEPGIKTTASGFSAAHRVERAVPLEAIYVLDPIDGGTAASCARERLVGAEAAVTLAHQTKLPASLVGPRHAGIQLLAAAGVASRVPVWKLRIARDFQRLPDAVEQILTWHSDRGSERGSADQA